MCIIAIKPMGKKMFSKDQITTMFTNNSDGCGYMYYDKKRKNVVINKGFMNVNALLKSLDKKDLTDTNVVLHFRIGTSGKMDAFNCHPYPVYQKNATNCTTDIGMAHNGVLYDYTPKKDSGINDTQVFIKNILSGLKKGFQYDTDKLRLIQELIGTNKLAFLDDNNRVVTIGNFIEDDGYIYSNTSYKTPRFTLNTTPSYSPTYTKGGYNFYKLLPTKDKKEDKKSINEMYYEQENFWGDTQESGFWKDYDEKWLY